MSADQQEARAPVMLDPGGAGWAEEPKVTQAELLLYAGFAGVVRLLGQAAVAAGDAYSLTCKHMGEALTSDSEIEQGELVEATWHLYESARATHREIAGRATALVKRWEEVKILPVPS